MFKPIRKKINEIDRAATEALLQSNRRGILAMNGDNGYPYAIPINYFYDCDKKKIYFHGAKAGHKVDVLKISDKICFTVYGNERIDESEPWAPYVQSAVVFGRCRLLEAGPESIARLKSGNLLAISCQAFSHNSLGFMIIKVLPQYYTVNYFIDSPQLL